MASPMAAASAGHAARADLVNRARCGGGFFDNKLVLLPLAAGVSFPATFIVTYAIAVEYRHVAPGFPFISDTGTVPPESCVFGQLLNMAAVAVALTIYVKYRQLLAAAVDDGGGQRSTTCFRRVNAAALCVGLAAAFGLTLVANFQWTNVLSVHMLGAFLVFIAGLAYGWLQCWLSCRAPPPLCGGRLLTARLLTMSVASLCLLLTLLGASLTADLQFMNYNFVPDPLALLATIGEWIMSFALAAMFLTFAADFRFIQVSLPVVVLPCGSSSETDESRVVADDCGAKAVRPPEISSYLGAKVYRREALRC